MTTSTRDLIEAKEAVAAVLDQLGLTAYLFEVEPHDGAWDVRIDCGRPSDWQSTTLAVDGKRLLSSRTNDAVRAELLEEWGKRLAQYRYPGAGLD